MNFKRNKPIINTGVKEWDRNIFFGGYVVFFIIVFWLDIDFYQNLWGLFFVILNLIWWYIFLEGRKEMNDREDERKRIEELKKKYPHDKI
jgi:hypothetical protein